MQAPNFSLNPYHGNDKISLSDITAKPVMLTFWASWCPDCHRDLPHKQKLYDTIDQQKLAIVTINVTGREGKSDDGASFIEKYGFTFPVLFDEGTKTYDAYQCRCVPQTILIDQQHEIRYRYGDQDDFMQISEGLAKLLN